MLHLETIQKLAVLHCVYQLIASADGAIDEDRDKVAIDLALTELGLNSYSWQSALHQNPHDCFFHINTLSVDDKQCFRALLLRITSMGGNQNLRTICAEHLFQLCGLTMGNCVASTYQSTNQPLT